MTDSHQILFTGRPNRAQDNVRINMQWKVRQKQQATAVTVQILEHTLSLYNLYSHKSLTTITVHTVQWKQPCYPNTGTLYCTTTKSHCTNTERRGKNLIKALQYWGSSFSSSFSSHDQMPFLQSLSKQACKKPTTECGAGMVLIMQRE